MNYNDKKFVKSIIKKMRIFELGMYIFFCFDYNLFGKKNQMNNKYD